MKNSIKNWLKTAGVAVAAITLATGCNKDLPKATPLPVPSPTGLSISDYVAADANYSILKAAIAKAGTGLSFNPADRSAVYTMFLPNNAAFIASGIASDVVINAMPAAQVAAIVNYHVIPGVKIGTSDLKATFPNMYLQSSLMVAAMSPLSYRMPICPSKGGASNFVNQVPITGSSVVLANGVVHPIAAILAPPSATLKTIIAADTSLTLLKSAIARADSGQTGLNKLDSVLNYGVANLTVFAPRNSAFRAMFPAGTPDATIIALLNNPAYFKAQDVRGMVAYHLLGSRAFTVNLPATATSVSTMLVIPGVGTALPVTVQLAGSTATVKGIANPSASNVVTANVHGVNGVLHVIDQALRPQ